jgi:hypothetical protein
LKVILKNLAKTQSTNLQNFQPESTPQIKQTIQNKHIARLFSQFMLIKTQYIHPAFQLHHRNEAYRIHNKYRSKERTDTPKFKSKIKFKKLGDKILIIAI